MKLLDRIAAIPGPLNGQPAFEVGPGPGGLTRAILRAGARLVAVERDHRCLPALAELEEAFPGQFVRAHRACLIPVSRLLGLQRADDGTQHALIAGSVAAPEVSRRNLPALRKLLRGT